MNSDFPVDQQLQVFLKCLQTQLPPDGLYTDDSHFLPLHNQLHNRLPQIVDHDSDCSTRSSTSDENDFGCSNFHSPADTPPDSPNDDSHFKVEGSLVQRRFEKRSRSEFDIPPENIEELLEEADLKRKRLARKAELARVSRKRKKMRIDELEGEVAELKQELERERKRTRNLEENARASTDLSSCAPAALSVNAQLSQAIGALTGQGGVVPDPALIQGFYSAYRNKVAENSSHLDALRQCGQPCLPVQFLQWVLSQNDKFYEDPNGLWASLFAQEVGASAEQLNSLRSLRRDPAAPTLTHVQAAANHLDVLLRGHMAESTSTVEKMMGILSPKQLRAFFQWVDRFGPVCVKINL